MGQSIRSSCEKGLSVCGRIDDNRWQSGVAGSTSGSPVQMTLNIDKL